MNLSEPVDTFGLYFSSYKHSFVKGYQKVNVKGTIQVKALV